MIVGYARTSSVDQRSSLENQKAQLVEAGAEKVFAEQVSAVDAPNRKQLDAAIEHCREGDVFVVSKIDRLARSVRHLKEIADDLETKGVTLRVLGMGLDTSTANGKLMLGVLGSVAEFERDILHERQREGIAKAKREGKHLGRPRSASSESNTEAVRRLRGEGLSIPQIARQIGIGKSSVHRLLKADSA